MIASRISPSLSLERLIMYLPLYTFKDIIAELAIVVELFAIENEDDPSAMLKTCARSTYKDHIK